jgi:hypothetical protein
MLRIICFGFYLFIGLQIRAQIVYSISVRDTAFVKQVVDHWVLRDSLPDGVWRVFVSNSGGIVSRIFHPRILVVEGRFSEQNKSGKFTYFNPNKRGQVELIENYSNGLLDGEYYVFDNGHIQTHGFYRLGQREGTWRNYADCWSESHDGIKNLLLGYFLVAEIDYHNGQIINRRKYMCAEKIRPVQ